MESYFLHISRHYITSVIVMVSLKKLLVSAPSLLELKTQGHGVAANDGMPWPVSVKNVRIYGKFWRSSFSCFLFIIILWIFIFVFDRICVLGTNLQYFTCILILRDAKFCYRNDQIITLKFESTPPYQSVDNCSHVCWESNLNFNLNFLRRLVTNK
jgi:hypothetical protein